MWLLFDNQQHSMSSAALLDQEYVVSNYFFIPVNLPICRNDVAAFAVLGSALGPGLSGWLIDRGVPYEQQLFAFAVCFACASAIMVFPFSRARQSLAP